MHVFSGHIISEKHIDEGCRCIHRRRRIQHLTMCLLHLWISELPGLWFEDVLLAEKIALFIIETGKNRYDTEYRKPDRYTGIFQ